MRDFCARALSCRHSNLLHLTEEKVGNNIWSLILLQFTKHWAEHARLVVTVLCHITAFAK